MLVQSRLVFFQKLFYGRKQLALEMVVSVVVGGYFCDAQINLLNFVVFVVGIDSIDACCSRCCWCRFWLEIMRLRWLLGRWLCSLWKIWIGDGAGSGGLCSLNDCAVSLDFHSDFFVFDKLPSSSSSFAYSVH